MSIAIIAGLGNPGPEYRDTRHNIGFRVVDRLAKEHGATWKKEARFECEVARIEVGSRRLLLAKPVTFMNASGRAIGALLRYHKLEPSALLLIYDDITLETGRPKLSAEGGAGGHNGVADCLQQVGSGFFRYRIGVGEKPHKEMDLADYVLSRFSAAEEETIAANMPQYTANIGHILEAGPALAMNTINQRNLSKNEQNEEQ